MGGRNVTYDGFDQAQLDRAMRLSMQDQPSEDRLFSEADLVTFAEVTGTNISDVKTFAAAVEEFMPEGCTDDELVRFAMFLAPAYGINDRYVEYAFQLTLANRNRHHDYVATLAPQAERERVYREPVE